MLGQRQNQAVPLDFNNLGGSTQNNYNNNNNNNYNQMNSMSGYPRGSYMNEMMNNNNNYNQNYANQTQQINNDYQEQNFQNNNNQQNLNNGYNNNYRNDNFGNNINQGMNEYSKNEVSSRGNINFRSPSPRQIRMEEQERKKMLLNNIQSQINLTRQTKLEQMKKNKEEDAKYLKDMMVYYPFGRGGGGAPIRDKSGNIITNRRALISDNKYNLASINVDDDYYEVWDKEKRIGRFYNNNNNINNAQYNNNNNYNQQLSNTGNNFRNMDYNNQNQNIYNNPQQNYGRPYSTNPRIMNNNNNFNNYNNQQNMNYYPEQENNYQMQENNNYQNNNPQFFNTMQRPNTQTISLTYDNYELGDNEQQRQIKENYRQDLLNQIEENKNKKEREKRRRKEEDEKEEERLRKEREEMLLKEQEEKNKNKQMLNKVQNENGLLILEKNKNANNNNEFNSLRNVKRTLKANIQTDENGNIIDNEAFDRIHQKEMESKMQLNNEIMKLREQMKDQQNDLFHQIAYLKQETQNANQQRFEALKEIDKLKEELSKQRMDENLRRKYVYDVVVNEARDTNNIVQESHLPKNDKPKVVLPVDSEKDLFYEEKIRHPNRIIPVPKLVELNENGVKTDSKFIDIDTHNLISGLELYEPNNKLISSQDEDYKINNRGIGIEGDYGTLRGTDNILKTSDVLMPNSNDDLNSNQVNISINNRKVNTFKNIKNVETIKDGNTENININLESIDDSNFEVNRIYNKNLERLRYLNDLENNFIPKKNHDIIKNNIIEKDNFDEFIKKLNKPVPTNITPDNDDEFEIEVSKVPK
jgi:hypothetical protein